MNHCDQLLKEVMGQAAALGIPFSKNIQPHVEVNRRAVTRLGCCRREGGGYTIEVAERVALGETETCREILAHELLHTCYGCQNHGRRWKGYAQRMNGAYGYHITRVTTNIPVGVQGIQPPKYILHCQSCGEEFRRYRACALTRHPERYRCKCGGRLTLEGS